MEAEVEGEVASRPGPVGRITLGVGLGAVLVLVGAYVGAKPLSDNSFFTHLATGRIILDDLAVPTSDPYTYHAVGEAWTVQSWLVSVMYAGLEDLFGLAGPRALHLLLAGALAGGIWWLTRAAVGLVPRFAVAGLGVAAGAFFWVERPLMVGLVCFCLLAILCDRGPLWVVVPLMWVWVNSHGSFPLGLVLVLALLAGRKLDGGDVSRLARVAVLVLVGTLVGGLASPLTGRLLLFPLTLLGRTDQLQAVSEWQSPAFADWGTRIFLLQLLLAILAAHRVRRWELVVPSTVFVAAALLGARNIPVAAIALTPLLAAAAPVVGDLRADRRSPLARGLVAVAVAGVLVLAVGLSRGSHLDLVSYPITEIAALEEEGVLPATDVRVAYRDSVGNYLEYRHGPTETVFFDDRFDFYSRETLQDMIDLHNGRHVLEILDRYDVDVVVWQDGTPVSDLLAVAPGWAMDDPLEPLEGGPEADDGTTGWRVFRRIAD